MLPNLKLSLTIGKSNKYGIFIDNGHMGTKTYKESLQNKKTNSVCMLYGGVPPHAAPLLAVRALGRGIGAVLGPRKAPLPTAC